MTKTYEILLVDDCSPDQAWYSIVELQKKYPEVKGLRLSRNFGQHIAISAGLAEAKGDVAIVMDCDLQDPPERIPEIYAKLLEGYDLVLARRTKKHHSSFRVLAAKTYFYLVSWLNRKPIEGFGTFSILSRKVIDAFLLFNERERHYLFILTWLGFRAGVIDYVHEKRASGKSSYSVRRLIQHAIDGQFFQATQLLNWIVVLGLLFAAGGVAMAGFFIVRYFVEGSQPGWTSLSVLILICTGAILTSLGVIGVYVGKVFDQAKDRPLYVIDQVSERGVRW